MKIDGKEFETKKELRTYMKKKRSGMSLNRILMHSSIITRKLFDLDEYKEADVLLAYVSYSSEVDTHFMIKDALKNGKKVAVPKVLSSTEMDFFLIDSFDDLKPGAFGILEPDSSRPLKMDPDKKYLILLPGIAFDDEKNRLGYGGGYYDRYLSVHTDIYKVMLAYELERTEDRLPCDELDVAPDIIITELNIY